MLSNLIPVILDGNLYYADAQYEPAGAGGPDEPPISEQFDIGEVFWEDRKTPVALTDRQIDRLHKQLLDDYHEEQEYSAFCRADAASRD